VKGGECVSRPGRATGTSATEATAVGVAATGDPAGGALVAWVRRYADPLRAVLGALVVLLVLFVPLSFGGSLALVGVAAAVTLGVTWVVRSSPPAAEHRTT